MSEPLFAHLHVHSEYSIVDGSIVIKKLIKKIKAMGHSHIALTDHGNMHAAVEFFSAAKAEGLTPIVGSEIYKQFSIDISEYVQEWESLQLDPIPICQQVLLAKNKEGYHQLLKVVSSGFVGEQLQDVPVVPDTALEAHASQLVAIASFTQSELGLLLRLLRVVLNGSVPGKSHLEIPSCQKLIALIQQYVEAKQKLYGKDGFYLEITQNNLPGQAELVDYFVECGAYFQVPVVASANAHYLDRDFSEAHALVVAIKNSLTMSGVRDRLRDATFHIYDNDEMQQYFKEYPEALANTLKIAEMCSHVDIEMGTYYLPKIDLGTQESPKEALVRLSHEGLERRFESVGQALAEGLTEEVRKTYLERLAYELQVIIQMGFPDYFLIVQDFIKWAKDQGIPVGPGRGSGAGSLVAYSLEITDLDPIPYNLIFERFLNPERVSMPDFDVDFCQWRREEVIKYCVDKYGATNVAQITTFGKLQAKGAVKSVGRAMNIGFNRVDRFTKQFPPDLGITLQQALDMEPRLREEMSKDEALNEAMQYALQIEGLTSHTSVHAAGLVISDGHITNYVPVYTTDGKSFITQYEMKPTEKVGLVKFDFLGLKTLTVIDKAVTLVNQLYKNNFAIKDIPMHDAGVFNLFCSGHTYGVFQCESAGMIQLILKLKPSCFEDIIALVALFRPGPLGSGMVDSFIERKHGREKIAYLHDSLTDILKETYGMILYQEQVQKIAATLASYSLGEADLLRRAMGKKIPEEMAKQKDRFLSGSKDNKIDLQLAEQIFELVAEFAKYGFNKSHSAAYGLVSYQTAYLKAHYPAQFLAASMTCDMDITDKIIRFIGDCKRLKVKIIPPDINRSELEFSVPEEMQIDFPLTAIKGVGEAAVAPLIDERKEGGRFRSLADLAHRLDLNRVGKKTLQLLTSLGALDGFGIKRDVLEPLIPRIVTYSNQYHEAQKQGQRTLFAFDEDLALDEEFPFDEEALKDKVPGYLWHNDHLLAEKKSTGVFLSGHPLDTFNTDMKSFGVSIRDIDKMINSSIEKEINIVALLAAYNIRRTKKGKLMAAIRLEQPNSATETVMFEEALQETELPPVNTVVLVNGAVTKSFDGRFRFNLKKICPLDDYRDERVGRLKLKLKAPETGFNIEQSLEQMAQVLSQSEGDIPVSLEVSFPEAQMALELSEYKISLTDAFLSQLSQVVLPGLHYQYQLV